MTEKFICAFPTFGENSFELCQKLSRSLRVGKALH